MKAIFTRRPRASARACGHVAIVAEIGEPPALPFEHRRPQRLVINEVAEELGGLLQVLRREAHARAAERFRHRAARVGEDRHLHGHGLDERHAEALVLAQRDVGVRVTIVGRAARGRHGAR